MQEFMASLLSCPGIAPTTPRRRHHTRFLTQPSVHHTGDRRSFVRLFPLHQAPFLLDVDVSAAVAELTVGGDVGATYSPASYYTSLGLFVISVPGLWSLIKRSVKSKVLSISLLESPFQSATEIKHFFNRNGLLIDFLFSLFLIFSRECQIVQKTFVKEGASAAAPAPAPNIVAGEILSFFTRNNFTVSDRGETITFEGMMVPSRGQAALLTFCTCISLASVGLVLSIAVPAGGNNWFWLMALSPLAGVYYWRRASRKEEIKVKMTVDESGKLSDIIVRGDDQQVEQMRKELRLSEKGMVYVKGIFEQ